MTWWLMTELNVSVYLMYPFIMSVCELWLWNRYIEINVISTCKWQPTSEWFVYELYNIYYGASVTIFYFMISSRQNKLRMCGACLVHSTNDVKMNFNGQSQFKWEFPIASNLRTRIRYINTPSRLEYAYWIRNLQNGGLANIKARTKTEKSAIFLSRRRRECHMIAIHEFRAPWISDELDFI